MFDVNEKMDKMLGISLLNKLGLLKLYNTAA